MIEIKRDQKKLVSNNARLMENSIASISVNMVGTVSMYRYGRILKDADFVYSSLFKIADALKGREDYYIKIPDAIINQFLGHMLSERALFYMSLFVLDLITNCSSEQYKHLIDIRIAQILKIKVAEYGSHRFKINHDISRFEFFRCFSFMQIES